VVELGETDMVPAAPNPEPTPWSIWMLVALVTFQIRVVDCPAVIDVGLAVNATMVGTPEVVVPMDALEQEGKLGIQPPTRSNRETTKSNFLISTSIFFSATEYNGDAFQCQ
jgi:hypothetical protein